MSIPYSEEVDFTYENIIAVCPHCHRPSVLNRATDLKDFSPVAFKEVKCLSTNCAKHFNINGDRINPPHAFLLFECRRLINEKRLMHCIVNIATSFESFFSHYLRVEIVYRPSVNQSIERINEVASNLYITIKGFTYLSMRNIFIRMVVGDHKINDLTDSERLIPTLPDLKTNPPDSLLKTYSNRQISDLLMQLKKSEIGEVRNQVVHKRAFRPDLQLAERLLAEARKIIFGLQYILDVGANDINWYRRST